MCAYPSPVFQYSGAPCCSLMRRYSQRIHFARHNAHFFHFWFWLLVFPVKALQRFLRGDEQVKRLIKQRARKRLLHRQYAKRLHFVVHPDRKSHFCNDHDTGNDFSCDILCQLVPEFIRERCVDNHKVVAAPPKRTARRLRRQGAVVMGANSRGKRLCDIRRTFLRAPDTMGTLC